MPVYPPAEAAWHPVKRLRQLESISGRGLLLGCGGKSSKPAAHYVTLSARIASDSNGGGAAGDGTWRLVYRSEAVGGTLNPEWQPLVWAERQLLQRDPLLDSGEVQVVLALHALGEEEEKEQQQLPAPAAPAELAVSLQHDVAAIGCHECAGHAAVHEEKHGGLGQPVLYVAASRPAFQVPSGASITSPAAARQPVTAGEAAVVPNGSQLLLAGSSISADLQQQQNSKQNGYLSPEAVQQEQDPVPSALEGQQQAGQQGQQGDAAADSAADQQQPGADRLIQAEAAKCQGPVDASPARSTLPAAECWPAAAAVALASTGCCPGRLVAAWQLDSLEQLFPAGSDLAALAALRQALQPNTLVLQFGDSACLWPQPMLQQATGPGSLQTSPYKKASSQAVVLSLLEEQGGSTAAAPAGATRRFANLLVSKLLRSTPNLQEASVLGASTSELVLDGASSDADSDAGSDITTTTATSQLTSVMTASELLPAGGSAGARGAMAAAAAASSSAMVSARLVTLGGAYQYITSLAALQGRLRDLEGRSQALQEQLHQRLGPEHERQQQQQQLVELGAEAARWRQRAAAAQEELADVRAAVAATKKQATVRAQALVTTFKVMQAASRRLGEAEASLQVEGGRGALVAVLRELVARRCQMVCQLGVIFQLGPTPVSILEAPAGGYLEDRLEQQWAGAAPTASAASSSSPGFVSSTPPWSSGSGGGYGGMVDTTYRQEMRLSIGGLEIQPGVWRSAFEEGAYDSDAAEDRAAGIALGYVAQMVDRLAAYLDVPLRYPLVLRGSRSTVVDAYPPAGTWAGEGDISAVRRPMFGRGEAAAAGGVHQPNEYPLYCESNRERPRFAVGVFLLNKDVIQLLQAHGISAAGPNQLLQNLYKVLLAAQSALPQSALPPLPQPLATPSLPRW